jgi:hypothetical protein
MMYLKVIASIEDALRDGGLSSFTAVDSREFQFASDDFIPQSARCQAIGRFRTSSHFRRV